MAGGEPVRVGDLLVDIFDEADRREAEAGGGVVTITYEQRNLEVSLTGTERWLFELSEPVRYDTRAGVAYRDGSLETSFVAVSWGRLGDTCIFPVDERGAILDMAGFKSWWGSHEPAEQCLDEWLAELVSA